MAHLNLTGQRTMVAAWLDEFQAFEDAMNVRAAIWNKLDGEQRKRWVRAACGTLANPKSFAESLDPVVWLALRVKRFLDGFQIEEAE